MKPFDFSLQKVLEYRRLTEQWAKEAYADSRARALEAEAVLIKIVERLDEASRLPAEDVPLRMLNEIFIERLQRERSVQEAVLAVEREEEAVAKQVWIEKRAEAKAMATLRERKYAQWLIEERRAEQNELDEWALSRRAA